MHSRSFAPPCSRQTVCGSKENGRPSNRRRGAGIKLAGADGKSSFVWLFLSYVLQSIGELLIMPIGYAMIGKLAPKQYQGIMMGSWMLVTGLASLFAGDFSGMIPEPTGTTAVATNAGYAKLFAELGAGSLAVGVVLVVLIETHSLPSSFAATLAALPSMSLIPQFHSVFAQADHRQGRDAYHRSSNRRSRRLNTEIAE